MSMIRSRWAAIGAAIAVSLGAGAGFGLVSATVDSGERPVYVPINPCRLMDTRSGDNNVGPRAAPLGPDETITVLAHGSNGECTGASAIPSDALGLVMNVTALRSTGRTFLTFWGEGANPGTANLNPDPGEPPTPNSVSTPLSSSGSFELFNAFATVEVVIDVNGYYVDHNHDDRYDTTAEVDAKIAAVTSGAEVAALEADVAALDASVTALQAEVDAVGSGRRFGREITSIVQVGSATVVEDLVVGANGLVVASGRSTNDLTAIGCLTQGCLLPAAYELDVAFTGTSTSITNGPNGAPMIAFERSSANELAVAECDTPSCATAQLRTLDTGVEIGATSIAVRPSGRPLIAMHENDDDDLKMISCTDSSCSNVPTRTTVDSAGGVGAFVSLAIGTDGLGTMAYRAGNLTVARCVDDACTSITKNVVDEISVFDVSMAIGIDGNPVISYGDNEDNALRLAVCADPACASATITTLDPAGSPLNLVGRDNSIAIDTDGNPVISYVAGESPGLAGELRLVRCDDPACTTWTVSVIDDDEPYESAIGVLADGSLVIAFNRFEGTSGLSDDTAHLAFVTSASHTPNQWHP